MMLNFLGIKWKTLHKALQNTKKIVLNAPEKE